MKKLLSAFAFGVAALAMNAFEIIDGAINDSFYYPSTVHTFKISVPEGYDSSRGACLYVGLDGILCDAPARIDSLMKTGDIPPIIGVYLQSGLVKNDAGEVIRYNRSNEFDAPDGRFARFLEKEVLPAVRRCKTASGDSLIFLDGSENAMIFGLSSGGICAFNAAWQRPDMFGKIYSGCGTFVPMRGADGLQSLVRKSEPRDIKVFLQDGYTDTWNPLFGSWYEANRLMASALEFAGYDCKFDWAPGGHSVVRTSAIFPEVMKWMWKESAAPKNTANNALVDILDNAGEWKKESSVGATAAGATQAVYPDGSLMVRPIEGSDYLWQWLIDATGKQYAGQPFYYLHSPENRTLRIGGMAFDAKGMLWVLTDAGIQICDQNGRVRGIIMLPVELHTALIDSRTAPLLAGSVITLADGLLTIITPAGTFTRRLNVSPAVSGVRPQSQGQG